MMSKFTVSLLCVVALAAGCQKSSDSVAKKTEPAEVAHHVEEQELNTITLTEQAEQRLGIQLAAIRVADVQRKRTFGSEIVIPPGQTIIVSAPLAGTLDVPENGAVAAPGSKVAAGQPMFRFKPLLTPERDVLTPADRIRVAQTRADVATAQILAERQVESAKIDIETADIEYKRALELLQNKAGSQRSLDAAHARLKLAQEAFVTAEARHKLLSSIRLDEEAGELQIRTIESPVAGHLQSIDAAAGETVSSGEPLFHVVKMDRVWIRVPVYVGLWREVDTNAEATIAEYGRAKNDQSRTAKYIAAPPSANPLATTVDVFYEVDNQDGLLYPGQRLAATLPMRTHENSLLVTFKAVVYDIYGGAWVYQQQAPRVYARRRVSVRFVDGPVAILEKGPEPGSMVVTDGAVELFGTEFGVGH